ncbi:MAG: response regulator [Proteobacteria bacterium]|nr:response regulator [Pseudomonadota bacterium]MBU1715803.1 response regulator [Pseudomonadota bacterium]
MAKHEILIVDDEKPVRDLLSRWLQGENYNCTTAASAMEALELLEHKSFSVLVSDINMPGMTGVELLEETRRKYSDMAVVMATAVDDRRISSRVLELGAYSYLIKPFDKSETVINIANAIRLRELELQNRLFSKEMDQLVLDRTRELRDKEAEVRNSREETISCLARAAEFRDNDTAHHTVRMSHYCKLLAEKIGLDTERCELIRTASPLHDVGKIGVPDEILLKPGRLTEQEFEIIKTHTMIGFRILSDSSSELLGLGALIAKTHHEKYDGSGYPEGLSGEDIPLEGRIAAICDVFDALTFDRVYKKAYSVDKAVEIIMEGKGTHFDPGLVDLFLDSMAEVLKVKEKFADDIIS